MRPYKNFVAVALAASAISPALAAPTLESQNHPRSELEARLSLSGISNVANLGFMGMQGASLLQGLHKQPATAVPGTVPGTVPNTVPGAVPSTVPGTVLNTVPGTVPNTVPGTVPNTVPGTGTDTGTSTFKTQRSMGSDANPDDELLIRALISRMSKRADLLDPQGLATARLLLGRALSALD